MCVCLGIACWICYKVVVGEWRGRYLWIPSYIFGVLLFYFFGSEIWGSNLLVMGDIGNVSGSDASAMWNNMMEGNSSGNVEMEDKGKAPIISGLENNETKLSPESKVGEDLKKCSSMDLVPYEKRGWRFYRNPENFTFAPDSFEGRRHFPSHNIDLEFWVYRGKVEFGYIYKDSIFDALVNPTFEEIIEHEKAGIAAWEKLFALMNGFEQYEVLRDPVFWESRIVKLKTTDEDGDGEVKISFFSQLCACFMCSK